MNLSGQDEDYEYAVLACFTLNEAWWNNNKHKISLDLFTRTDSVEIFKSILEVGKPDIILVTKNLRSRNVLAEIGGASRVSEVLVSLTYDIGRADYYLSCLIKKKATNSYISLLEESAARLKSGGKLEEEVEALKDKLETNITARDELPYKTYAQALDSVIDGIDYRVKNPGKLPGITTGFKFIDKKTYGLQPAHVWVISGSPGDGKSVLMQNFIENAIASDKSITASVYQLEMPTEEQAFRFLTSDSEVTSENLWLGNLTNYELQAITKSVSKLKKYGVKFKDVDNATADEILNDIKNSSDRLVMVDYLQLLDGDSQKGENREQYIARISRRLKKIAKSTGKTIITGSQLNDDGLLRESRAIGQDADKVFRLKKLIDKKTKENDDSKRVLECLKNRGGPRDWFNIMNFMGNLYKFREVDYI